MMEIIFFGITVLIAYKLGYWATTKTLNKLFGKRTTNQPLKQEVK
jgi:hypothetical protein